MVLLRTEVYKIALLGLLSTSISHICKKRVDNPEARL
jgi:hypothetical protein